LSYNVIWANVKKMFMEKRHGDYVIETYVQRLRVMKLYVALILALGLIVACDGADNGSENARQVAARLGAEALGTLVAEYRQRNGELPSEWEQLIGIQFPGSKVIFDGTPLDPWSHAYVLARVNGGVTIISLGQDGLPGGNGYDTDISHLVGSSDD
jgi:hypothetical protein